MKNPMLNPLDYARKIAYSYDQVLYFTYEQARVFRNKPGVYIECGVAAGAQIIAMIYGAPEKTIYAFDSFEGIPLPSNRDDQMPGIKMLSELEILQLPDPGKQILQSTGATSVPIQSFFEHIHNSGVSSVNVIAVRGWFEETLKDWDAPEIALLRLDGDLYNSTWVCLQHLFPKVIKGGCVIIDDIELPGCKAACDEYFALIGYQPDYKFISNISFFYK